MRAALTVLSLALSVSAFGQSGDLVLLHANVIDGLGGAPVADRAVVVRGGRISDIVASSAAPSGGTAQDLRGKYVLPGLIDSHVHIGSLAQARKALFSGITTVRSMGVSAYYDVGLRELKKRGVVDVPEVLAAGYHVRPRPSEDLFLVEPSLGDLFSGVTGAVRLPQGDRGESRARRRLDQDHFDRARRSSRHGPEEADDDSGGDRGHRRRGHEARGSRREPRARRRRRKSGGRSRRAQHRARDLSERGDASPDEREGDFPRADRGGGGRPHGAGRGLRRSRFSRCADGT